MRRIRPFATRVLPALAAAWLAGSASAGERNVSLASTPAGLAGTLTMPDRAGAATGVLILAGAGPTDRDGNQPGQYNDSLKLLAQGLAGCGIASLRPDRRGVAGSHDAGAFEEDLNFDDYVTDAVRWAKRLSAEPGIASLALLGHGEGGLFATLAAQRLPGSKLVLLASSGRPAGEVIRRQLAGGDISSALRRRADEEITSLEHGEQVDDVPQALGFLFRGSIQPYLIAWFAHDPVVDLARTTMPVLVVQGGTDVQVPATDGRLLAAARPGVELSVFPTMNHVLRAAPADWPANLATYGRRDLPLAPGLVARLCRFLRP